MAENITLYERMASVETQLKSIAQWQDEIKDSVKEIKASIQTMTTQNDTKYAFKRTETTVDAAIWIVVTFVILGLLAIFFKSKWTSSI